MNLLLDTHAFIWFVDGDPQLPSHARAEIESTNNTVWLSTACVWEMAIKTNLGKLTFSLPLSEYVELHVPENGFHLLSVDVHHALAIDSLPLHHKDPFDRLIIAQCKVERMAIVSGDTVMDAYGVQRIWS
jgi:PIN domain nuclease of toxin-antitoxin system